MDTVKTVSALLCAAFAFTGVSAEDIYVGTRETVRHEASTVGEQSGRVIVAPQGMLLKMGNGTWTLPTSKIAQGWDANVSVGQGTLRIRRDAAPTEVGISSAPMVMQDAAVWFDAQRTESFSHDDSGNVVDWLDCRETGNATDGYLFTRAHADTSFANLYPELKTTNGVTGLYFQGFESGCWMNLIAADGSQADVKSWNVFAVQGQFCKLGTLFGARSGYRSGNPSLAFVPGYAQVGRFKPMWVNMNYDVPAMLAAHTYIDGCKVDAFSSDVQEFPSNRVSLLEVEFLDGAGGFQCFFNDRDYWGSSAGNRVGGEYICEVVAFTNALTAAERLQVENYLMTKWLGEKRPSSITVSAENGTRVELEQTDANAESIPLSVGGVGRFVKMGDGLMDLGYLSALDGFTGKMQVEGGTLKLRSSMPFAAEAGKRIDANCIANDGPAYSSSVVAEDTFVKGGDGALRVAELSSSVRKVKVLGGELTFEAPVSAAPDVGRSALAVTGCVPNASFELGVASTTHTVDLGESGFNGWHAIAGEGANASNLAWVNHSAYEGGKNVSSIYWNLPTDVPDGECVLAINKGATVWTTITLPQDGTYELTFKAASRIGRAGLILELGIGESAEAMTSFGYLRSTDPRGRFYACRYVLPRLSAGEHRLWFRQVDDSVDKCCLVDDFRLTRLDDDEASCEVPNGSFEQFKASYDEFTAPLLFGDDNFNGLAEWTVVQAPALPDGATLWHSVSSCYLGSSPVTRSMGVKSGNISHQTDRGWPSQFYNVRDGDDGCVQLYLQKGASAHVEFTPPAGSYYVAADIGLWRMTSDSAETMKATSRVSLAGGESVSLGAVDISKVYVMKRRIFPKAFTVDGTTRITLELAAEQMSGDTLLSGHLLLDNVRLVRADRLSGINLIDNGSFALESTWKYANGPGLGANYKPHRVFASQAVAYGANWLDEAGVVVIDNGAVHQDITVPVAGRHRLSVAARKRVSWETVKQPLTVQFYLAKDGVTNDVATLAPAYTNFTMSSWAFDVPEPGDWNFGVRGLGTGGEDVNTLIDDISLRYEPYAADLPEMNDELEISVARGARLNLDFGGTQTVRRLVVEGFSRSGLVRAADFPNTLSGAGALFVVPRGLVITVR